MTEDAKRLPNHSDEPTLAMLAQTSHNVRARRSFHSRTTASARQPLQPHHTATVPTRDSHTAPNRPTVFHPGASLGRHGPLRPPLRTLRRVRHRRAPGPPALRGRLPAGGLTGRALPLPGDRHRTHRPEARDPGRISRSAKPSRTSPPTPPARRPSPRSTSVPNTAARSTSSYSTSTKPSARRAVRTTRSREKPSTTSPSSTRQASRS